MTCDAYSENLMKTIWKGLSFYDPLTRSEYIRVALISLLQLRRVCDKQNNGKILI